jgi:hypothetical protein
MSESHAVLFRRLTGREATGQELWGMHVQELRHQYLMKILNDPGVLDVIDTGRRVVYVIRAVTS